MNPRKMRSGKITVMDEGYKVSVRPVLRLEKSRLSKRRRQLLRREMYKEQ